MDGYSLFDVTAHELLCVESSAEEVHDGGCLVDLVALVDEEG